MKSNKKTTATLTFTLTICFCFMYSSSFSQEQGETRQEKTGIDTTSLLKKFDSLNTATNKLENLNEASLSLTKENIDYNRTIDSLKNIQTKTEGDNRKLERLRLKLKNNIDSLSKIAEQLRVQKSNHENAIKDLKSEIRKIDSVKQKYLKDTLDLSLKKDTLAKDTSSLNKQKKEFAIDIEKQKAVISKQLDSLEVIARIDMRDSVTIFNDSTGKEIHVKIQEINISVREGIIMEIIVKTDSGIYRNKRAIIDLLHFGQRGKTDKLYYEHQNYKKYNEWSYVFLDDVIKYSPIRSYTDVAYGDFDITLLFTDENKSYLIKESTSINTYFNIAAFTDIKGISGEPNGLAQFTAEAKFITRTSNFPNTAVVPFNYISFRAGLSKFDNDFKGAKLFNDDSVSRKDILQRATYYLGININLLRGFASPLPSHLFSDLQLNIGYNFIGTKVYDTLFKDIAKTVIDTTFKTITQNQFFIEPYVSLNRHKNFSMSVGLPFYFNNIKKSAEIANSGLEFWICPSINLMYYGKRDSGSKIFFRYNHFINLKEKTQAFTQMQLGYSVNLTEVWNGK